MSFSEAIVSVFSQYADFSGRARRSEYWYFFLLNIIASAVISILASILGALGSIISVLWALGTIVPGLAVCWRRLHDTGRSGAWAFISLVPLVGEIILLVFLCTDSQPGSNQYGPSPKY